MPLKNQNSPLTIAIQGYPGSFHSVAAAQYWKKQEHTLIPADSFDILGQMIVSDQVDIGIMAIENSIAGTILQNYRILRENDLWVSGELYLRIRHHLLGCPGTQLSDIKSISSHPMAMFQCRSFLNNHPHWKIIESEDTALSAQRIAESGKKSKACIASEQAAEIHGLDIVVNNIETNKANYTRFFIVNKRRPTRSLDVDKASVYIRIPGQKGQLLKVLMEVQNHDINMSKLQSFPVVGSFGEYFFHLDLEFDHVEQYDSLKESLRSLTYEIEEIGLYKRADVSAILEKQQNNK
jgi:prephenate dehydratase